MISLDTARRQAQRRNLPEATELRELLLHGILHLLGRDHGDGDIADEPMLREQRRLLESLPWASCTASWSILDRLLRKPSEEERSLDDLGPPRTRR